MNENENKYLDYSGLATLISEIRNRFPSNDNLKTVNGTSIIGSGNIDTKQFKVLDFGTSNYVSIWDLTPGDYIIPNQTSTKWITCKYNNKADTSTEYAFRVNKGGILFLREEISGTITSRTGVAITTGIHPNGRFGSDDGNLIYVSALSNNSRVDFVRVSFNQILDNNSAQYINGVKTFNTLPETSLNPTTVNQLVRKGYIDSIMADIYTKSQTYSKAEVESYVATALSTALADYYTKSQIYNKQEVDAKIDEVTFNAISYDSTTETLIITSTIAGGNGEEY